MTVERLGRHVTLVPMSPRRTPFPFPPLPKGEFHPRRDLGHWHNLVQRDARIIRWFVQDEMHLEFGASPLGELLVTYESADRDIVVPPVEAIPIHRRRHYLQLSGQFERA